MYTLVKMCSGIRFCCCCDYQRHISLVDVNKKKKVKIKLLLK
jgi:hypothetical protein